MATTMIATTEGEQKQKRQPTQYVYFFGGGKADGNGKMKDELGGKGAGLAEMTNAGLPVPPGFTIQTEACREYMRQGGVSQEVDREMEAALARLEKLQGQKLGKGDNPLLVSVRSGAKFSMPGMMDTILNLGLNDQSVEALAKRSHNPRFAYDSYRRLIQMFGNVVLDIEKEEFDKVFDAKKKQNKTKFDTDLDAKALQEVIAEYKKVVKKHAKRDFPQDAHEQLVMARDAVFRSWQNERAKTYRRINAIDDMLGTAVNVQAMVFGNLGDSSATGVGFTRNPATGNKEFYGEFLLNAQGEDVVSGVRTPVPILELEKIMPSAYNQLREITTRLEQHYRDMQDFEFTIQEGKLYMLQTRNGKRTGLAAVRVAIQMVDEGLITKEEAIFRVEPNQLYDFLVPRLDEKRAKIEVPLNVPGTIPQPVWPNFSASQTPLPGAITSGFLGYLDPDASRPPRQNQWSIGVQREITPNTVIEASYVGNRGVWWTGPLGYLNQISPQGFANYGLSPYSNPADNLVLGSALNSAAVISRVGNIVPYPGLFHQQHAVERFASVPPVQHDHCNQFAHGQDLVRLSSDEGDQAALAWFVGKRHFHLGQGHDGNSSGLVCGIE